MKLENSNAKEDILSSNSGENAEMKEPLLLRNSKVYTFDLTKRIAVNFAFKENPVLQILVRAYN